MLTSNIKKQNTILDIVISRIQTISVYLDKKTGYLSIVRNFNPITGMSEPLLELKICGTFNQPIIYQIV